MTITRQDRRSEDWYLGSLTDEESRSFEIPVDFLDPNRSYVVEIYADGPDADWPDNPHSYRIDK